MGAILDKFGHVDRASFSCPPQRIGALRWYIKAIRLPFVRPPHSLYLLFTSTLIQSPIRLHCSACHACRASSAPRSNRESCECLLLPSRNSQKEKTRTFVEGYHFGPLWSRRKVVRFDTDVPINESPCNLRYVDMKSKYSRTGTSLTVHESRVHIGQDMFLVSGYWDPKAEVNRSVLAVMKIVWRGEISVIRAGRYIPYTKYMKDGQKAELAVKRYVYSMSRSIWTLTTLARFAQVFKHRKLSRKLVPKAIVQ